MAIITTAEWQCHPGSETKVIEALQIFVKAIRPNEPGTKIYTALQKAQDKTHFMTYFIFEDEAARDYHRSTEWVKQFADVIYPELVEPVVFTEYFGIASTDIQTPDS
jgi:quinol monooxygenase YgiN